MYLLQFVPLLTVSRPCAATTAQNKSNMFIATKSAHLVQSCIKRDLKPKYALQIFAFDYIFG
jgi:hypothetical protein